MNKNICVFCGSSIGNQFSFISMAKELARTIYLNNDHLIYGGGKVGLMGVIAEEMLKIGGHVTGIMPQHLADYELFHKGIQEAITVKTMAERKEMLLEKSDFFVALPGGFGTLDEISEVITSNQLMIMNKPMGILNVDGFFDGLKHFFNKAVECELLRKEHRDMIIFDNHPKILLERLEAAQYIKIKKWIEDSANE